jgi:hypothetical protein
LTPRVIVAAGRIRSIEKMNNGIGNRTRYLPACSIVSQSTMLPRVQKRVLRRIFGPKREDIKKQCENLPNAKLNLKLF